MTSEFVCQQQTKIESLSSSVTKETTRMVSAQNSLNVSHRNIINFLLAVDDGRPAKESINHYTESKDANTGN